MEADDLGPVRFHHGAGRFVERRAPAWWLRHIRIEAGFGIVAGEVREPGGLTRGIVSGIGVAEEVEIDRAARAGANPVERRPKLDLPVLRARQRTQPTGLADGGDHLWRRGTGPWAP